MEGGPSQAAETQRLNAGARRLTPCAPGPPPGDASDTTHTLAPAGTSSKRVYAPRPLPPSAPLALVRQQQEGAAASKRAHLQQSFSHFSLQREWDLFAGLDGASATPWWPPFHLRRRSAIREVLAFQGLVLALAECGVCVAYDQGKLLTH